MEQEIQPAQPQAPIAPNEVTAPLVPDPEYRGLRWVFIGGQGLRAGWSAAIFFILSVIFTITLGTTATAIARHIPHVKTSNFTPATALIGEVILFLAVLGAVALVALMERRRIMDYNLRGPRPLVHFFSGIVAGFAALSALVGALVWGGWLHFGPAALSGARYTAMPQSGASFFCLPASLKKAAFAAFCSSPSLAASTSGGRWARLAQPASYCFLLPAATASGAFISRPCWVCRRVYCCTLRKRRERPSGRRHGLLRRSLASSTPATAAKTGLASLPRR